MRRRVVNIKETRSFEKSGAPHPKTQSSIPEDVNFNLVDAILLCFNIELYVFTSITQQILRARAIFVPDLYYKLA